MLKQSQQIADVLDFQGCQEAAKPLVLSETGNIARMATWHGVFSDPTL